MKEIFTFAPKDAFFEENSEIVHDALSPQSGTSFQRIPPKKFPFEGRVALRHAYWNVYLSASGAMFEYVTASPTLGPNEMFTMHKNLNIQQQEVFSFVSNKGYYFGAEKMASTST